MILRASCAFTYYCTHCCLIKNQTMTTYFRRPHFHFVSRNEKTALTKEFYQKAICSIFVEFRKDSAEGRVFF